MLRIFGGLFLVLTLLALALDGLAWSQSGEARLRPLGEAWFKLHRESWLLLQPAIERHLHEDLWFAVVEPVTQQPAVLIFGALTVLFLGLRWLFRAAS